MGIALVPVLVMASTDLYREYVMFLARKGKDSFSSNKNK